MDVVFDALGGSDAVSTSCELLVDQGKFATTTLEAIYAPYKAAFAKGDKRVGLIHATYKLNAENTALGVLVQKNLPEMLEKGIIKVRSGIMCEVVFCSHRLPSRTATKSCLAA